VQRYRSRISGPLLDRIDLHVEVPTMSESELADAPASEPSRAVRVRVDAARARQLERQGELNARLEGGAIERHCAADEAATKLLRQAVSRLALSVRGFHRVLKVARTIADLVGRDKAGGREVAEALQYRSTR
jgi:magnesium chelatase family protein